MKLSQIFCFNELNLDPRFREEDIYESASVTSAEAGVQYFNLSFL